MLTYEQGKKDAQHWADYINVGMEHGSFDIAGLAEYMRGLVDGGPTHSGHRTPPVDRRGAGQRHRRGLRPLSTPGSSARSWRVACTASCSARRSRRTPFVPSSSRAATPQHAGCRSGAGDAAGAAARQPRGEARRDGPDGRPYLGIGTRGHGSESTCAPIWGLSGDEYLQRADPAPLNPQGELLLGVKLESPEGVAHCEEILAVPGLGFAEMGPGDLSLSLGYLNAPRNPYPAEMTELRERIFAAAKRYKVPFLEGQNADTIKAAIDEGVRVIAGNREETAKIGRAHSGRTMPA